MESDDRNSERRKLRSAHNRGAQIPIKELAARRGATLCSAAARCSASYTTIMPTLPFRISAATRRIMDGACCADALCSPPATQRNATRATRRDAEQSAKKRKHSQRCCSTTTEEGIRLRVCAVHRIIGCAALRRNERRDPRSVLYVCAEKRRVKCK